MGLAEIFYLHMIVPMAVNLPVSLECETSIKTLTPHAFFLKCFQKFPDFLDYLKELCIQKGCKDNVYFKRIRLNLSNL